jgi:hypothetical protein
VKNRGGVIRVTKASNIRKVLGVAIRVAIRVVMRVTKASNIRKVFGVAIRVAIRVAMRVAMRI